MSINKIIEKIYNDLINVEDKGKLADYIPELSRAKLDSLGIVLIDSDRNVYKYGDFNIKFSIQSISKIFSLALAIGDQGMDRLLEKVNFNATEKLFNTYGELEKDGYIPANPLINAGAIVITSLIEGNRIDRIIKFMEENLGEKLEYNFSVYKSERDTGDRNKAIAYLLKNKGILEEDFLVVLDDYFKQCSIEMDLLNLAKLGYMFASGGFNYFGDKTLSEETVRIINSIMITAGMYNYSGHYAMEVGIPSKSGVAGAILGVVPNKYTIAVYSPGLDENGNSVLGQEVMKSLSKELNCSIF